MALQYPVATFSPEEFPCTLSAPELPEEDDHYLGTDEESSKESSLQSSLQDSSLTELEGKMASTGIGAGSLKEIRLLKLLDCCQFFNTAKVTKHCLSFVLEDTFSAFKATFYNGLNLAVFCAKCLITARVI